MTIKKQIQTVLYLGGLWGIAEATIGHLLHYLPCGISGIFMFPIGFYFMYNAYTQTESQKAILLTGIIAASVKIFDIFLPARSAMSITNPVISIIMESLVVFGFIKYFENQKSFKNTIPLGLSWVILFTLSQAIIFQPETGLYTYPIFDIFLFIASSGILSGILVGLFLQKEDFAPWKPSLSKQTYIIPIIALQVAVILEIVNSIII